MKQYYFIIQTEVNQECFVKSRLLSVVPSNYRVIIPKEKVVISIKDKRLFYINRLMPEYIIVESTDSLLSTKIVDMVSDMKSTASFLYEKNNSGNTLAKIEKSEVSKFVKNNERIYNNFVGIIDIIFGQYAGYTGNLLKIENEEVSVEVNNAARNIIKIPIWYIGKSVGELTQEK